MKKVLINVCCTIFSITNCPYSISNCHPILGTSRRKVTTQKLKQESDNMNKCAYNRCGLAKVANFITNVDAENQILIYGSQEYSGRDF
ncbi:MAG: hypothetical protein ACOVP5_05505, partial [Chitinophagales bacterium]